MIGNRVRLITTEGPTIMGTLHRLDQAGATIYREHSLPEGQGNVFIPAHRIVEVVDLGRAA
jgi:sortase (surface protein transpeptidase)